MYQMQFTKFLITLLVVCLVGCSSRSNDSSYKSDYDSEKSSRETDYKTKNKPLPDSDSKSEERKSSEVSKKDALGFPLVFSTDEILEFEQTNGLPQWIPELKERIQGASWKFNADGTFVYSPINSRDDLYPLPGTFTVNGKSLEFSAYKTSTFGNTGSATAQIMGSVNLNSSTPRIMMDTISTMGNSAKVNDIKFASDSASAYRVKATLIQR